ncbi:MAG: hypothetical protein C0504_11935 [Candidatus Solibacter sp.]|nr:hypothetical protein [Candidatus Solibacter sp.]
MADSTFRYHLFGASPWDWFPLWTTNKALSWTAAALLASAYLIADKTDARRFGLLGLALTAVHCLVIGLPGWLTPSKWPGSLPPITFMGFLTALLPLLKLVRR